MVASPVNPFSDIGPLPSLNLKNTTGAGTAYSLPGGRRGYTIFSKRASTGASGGSTRASFVFQGSVDGTNWVTIGSTNRLANAVTGSLASTTYAHAMRHVRLSITAFTTAIASTNPDKVAVSAWIVPWTE